MSWHAIALKGANYLGISLYAKGNLTQHYNKPRSSHGFSAILRMLWQSSAMSQLAKENGERHGKICQSKIRRWPLINCMINNNILDKIYSPKVLMENWITETLVSITNKMSSYKYYLFFIGCI